MNMTTTERERREAPGDTTAMRRRLLDQLAEAEERKYAAFCVASNADAEIARLRIKLRELDLPTR